MKSKELRAKRFKLIEDARALIATENPTAEQTASFDTMMAEADRLKAQIDRIEIADVQAAEANEQMRAQAEIHGISSDEQADRKERENGAFDAWLRGGRDNLNAEQVGIFAKRFRAAQSVGSDGGGGYTVPTGFYDQLIEAQKRYGGMLEVSTIIDTTMGNDLPIPTTNDTSNSGAILSENTQADSNVDVVFSNVVLGAYTYTSKIVLVSNELLQDSAFDLNAKLAQWLGTRVARATNTHFTTGDGSSKPNGVVHAATLGVTAASQTAIAFDEVVDLEHSVDPEYRRNGKWMMSDACLKVLKKIKDDQHRPLWLAGLAVGEPDTIGGYSYIVNQDMDAPSHPTAGAGKPLAFGDFSNYFIRRVSGARVMRLTERYADYNQTGFVCFQRWDGALVDAGTHPVKYLQML